MIDKLQVLQNEIYVVINKLENVMATISMPILNDLHVSCLRTILPEIALMLKTALIESDYEENIES